MKIKYFAWLKNITKTDSEEINSNDIKDILSLKNYLCKKYPKLKTYIKNDDIIRFAINLEYHSDNKSLSKNDEVALFPPVSGG
tara:strand:+ start:2955 stop:3203 length:249 start_codon:yes stop_codon:yes gene_type:complete